VIKRFTFSGEPLRPSESAERATLGRNLAEFDAEPRAPFEYVLIEWFEEGLLTGPLSNQTVVLARGEVKRGADWLDAHRGDDRPKLKHMTVARRADGLTPEEFAHRWSAHAGTASGTPIPEAARGSAYIQNHPMLNDSGWPYDAINEVYLDDATALRSRIEWFAANDVANRDRDLFATTEYLVLEEIEVGR
jgi:hypothetical protein